MLPILVEGDGGGNVSMFFAVNICTKDGYFKELVVYIDNLSCCIVFIFNFQHGTSVYC